MLSPRARGPALAALALALGGLAAAYVFRGVTLAALAAALARQSPRAIGQALALTAASFACLACHDLLSVHVAARGRVRRRVALLAGAAGSAVANAVGFHAVSGTAVRARFYLAAGLGAADVARVASLSWLSLVAGNAAMLAGAELVQAASEARAGVHLAAGAALAGALTAFVAWLARGPGELGAFGHRLPLPPAPLALAQMAVGAVESATAVGALYVLLPPDLAPPFGLFAAGCIVAVTLGVLAHTPGGIGVFEASMTALLAGAQRADLVAALLSYRIVYGLLPFALALLALAATRTRPADGVRRA